MGECVGGAASGSNCYAEGPGERTTTHPDDRLPVVGATAPQVRASASSELIATREEQVLTDLCCSGDTVILNIVKGSVYRRAGHRQEGFVRGVVYHEQRDAARRANLKIPAIDKDIFLTAAIEGESCILAEVLGIGRKLDVGHIRQLPLGLPDRAMPASQPVNGV